MTKHHDPESGRVRKFVGRLLHHGPDSRMPTPDGLDTGSGAATPTWISPRHRGSSSAASSIKAASKQRPDAGISLELWNEAYNSLRDTMGTSGLVTVYESILSQELPHGHTVGGMNLSLGRTDEERFLSLTSVTDASLQKAHASRNSQVDDSARILLQASKDTIKAVWMEYPSAAVAWSGICVLTPLLLDPIMHKEDMRRGIVHVLGRIPWYMHLSELLMQSSWKDGEEIRTREAALREKIVKLYRIVLEFDMFCICATASSWNHAAKNVVGWQGLSEIVREIEDLDIQIAETIDSFAPETMKKVMLSYDKDMDLRGLEVTDSAEAGGQMDGHPAHQNVTRRYPGDTDVDRPIKYPSVRV